MTFKHDRLSASGSAEDTQAIMVGTTTEPTMKPMSIDNDGNGNDDGGVVEGVEWEKGQMQPPAYRDKWFAVVFFLQLFAVPIVAFAVGIPQLEQIGAAPNDFAKHNGDDLIDNGSSSSSGNGSAGIAVLMFIGVSAMAAIGLSGLSLFLMNRFSESCVKVAFVASPVVFVLFGLILLSSNDAVQQSFAGVWFIIALISVLYAYCYWSHIPFASANLKTALSAVGAHYGVVSVSFLVALLGSVYSIVWWVAVGGVILAEPSECQEVVNDDVAARQQQADDCQNDFTNIYFFMLLLSYYWTHYTLQGITRVTVAGTVGTWWFEPEGRASCCSNTVRDSLARSVTYSFGSICLGSLIVAIVQTLKQSARNQRNRSGGSLLLCVVECLLACLRDILQYINDWAFVYVGLYGYGFIDSAKNVFNLFRSRGWTTIVTNSLVVRTLILVNLMVGALTGVVSLVVGYAAFGVFHVLFYGVGVVFGIVLASITLTVVDGAVKTSIVCFAEAPREFEVNHPELYHTMTSAYEERYPTVFAGIGTPDTSGGMGVGGGGRSVPAATAVPLT